MWDEEANEWVYLEEEPKKKRKKKKKRGDTEEVEELVDDAEPINRRKSGRRRTAPEDESVTAAFDAKRAGQYQSTSEVTVEIEGQEKPAMIAEWITQIVA